MLNKSKVIYLGLILGMIISLSVAMICVIYGIVTIISYFSPIVILIIFFGLFQIVPFLLCLNSYLNHERQLFVTGLVTLTSFVVPGVMILIGYFIKQKRLLTKRLILN